MGSSESRNLTTALLALTFVTGIVDAVSFLALGGVFAAMQTGNVIFLGLGIAGAPGAPFVAPVIGLAAFLLGAALAAFAWRGSASAAKALFGPALTIEVGLLALAALIAAVADPSAGAFGAYLVIFLLSLTMGLRNTIARHAGGPDLATTVLNLTMTAFAASSPLGFASGAELTERAAGIAAILAGAVTGALLVKADTALPLALAAVVTFTAALDLRSSAATPS
ncbi:MAG TPA: YoaK family protein [Solirubrobacterales bacterium]|nr:YoaK family protein [Solirubrobacterales bacterium]